MVLRRVMDGFYIKDLLMYNNCVYLYLLGFYMMFLFFYMMVKSLIVINLFEILLRLVIDFK